jgi:hypothetical protein
VRWVAAAVVVVLALLALYVVAKRLPPVYRAEASISTDIGVRDIIRDRKPCKEYFRLRDGRVVKTVCPP